MSIKKMAKNKFQENYFKFHGVSEEMYENYDLQKYLVEILPKNKDVKILDIGCGFGQMLINLRKRGYKNLKGIDICKESCDYCSSKGLDVNLIEDIIPFSKKNDEKYDFIIMAHVLEHIEKNRMIETIECIRKSLLKRGGRMVIMVPNAQSNTGAYWLFEDFTHKFLFTVRSLSFVLKSGGFKNIKFLDVDATDHLRLPQKILRKFFLKIYSLNKSFWNKMTSSTYHKPSPRIFGFELRAVVKKE